MLMYGTVMTELSFVTIFVRYSIAFAGTVIRHLKNIGVISPHGKVNGRASSSAVKPAMEDAPLLLSQRAQERAYFPEGVLDHHHAVQFVSFAPPFEKAIHITGLAPSRSQDDALSSLGSLSGDRQDIKNIIAQLGSSSSFPHHTDDNPPSPRSVIDLHQDQTSGRPIRQQQQQDHRNIDQEEDLFDPTLKTVSRDVVAGDVVPASDTLSSKPKIRGFFSKLMCCSHGNDVNNDNNNKPSKTGITPGTKGGDFMSMDSSMSPGTRLIASKLHQIRESSLTSLSEEEELQWLSYSIQPIAEDQSLAGGSVISMSAPLLKSAGTAASLKGDGGMTHSSESVGGFPQPRTYGGRDMFEF